MRKAIASLVLVSSYVLMVVAPDAEQQPMTTTTAQAKALVIASLSEEQQRLPRVEAEQYEAPGTSRFLFFTVTWEGTPKGSVVVGNYAVDSYTGDVFSATASCYEQKNKKLQAFQARVRAKLHLSPSEYRRLKTKGPLCEQQEP